MKGASPVAGSCEVGDESLKSPQKAANFMLGDKWLS
jgi:hypothetical protein